MIKNDFTRLVPVKTDDPTRTDKYQIMSSINRVADLINSLNRDMENRILLVVSIAVSALIGYLLSKGQIIWAINTSILLGVGLLATLIKEAKEKLKFKKMLLSVYNNAKHHGVILR